MQLGRISGSVTTTEFSFKAEARVKKLQYIALKDFEGRWILAYVDSIVKYPNKTLANAKVIGYRDQRGFLRQVAVPFEPETPVYSAEEDLIRSTLGLKKEGLYVGHLTGYDIKVNLPIKHLITKHIAILAKSGAGKSYAAGVLLEELAESNVPVVVFDPHGEYSTLVRKNEKKNEVKMMGNFGVGPKSYRGQVNLFSLSGKNPVRLGARLRVEEIIEMVPTKISAAQKGLIYSSVKNLEGKDYTLRDVIEEVESIESNAKWSLVSLLEVLENTRLFSLNPTKPEDIVRKGKISIVDLKDGQPEIQQLVVMKLSKELFEARKYGKVPEFLMVVEEAHNFAPERGFGEVSSSKILRTLASEGRKFGLGLCMISQRPAKVDKNILSQASTQIILKVTNPNDVKAIMESVEGVGHGTKEEIKDLPIGNAMVVGVTEQPLLIDIRVRRSEHGGESIRIDQKEIGFEERISTFSPKISQSDVRKSFKGIGDMTFLNYPLWKAACVYGEEETDFYVDGILGEIVYWKGGSKHYSKGIRPLLELPPSQRSILLYLFRNRESSLEKISSDLKMLLSNVQTGLRSLAERKFIVTDGYMFRNNFSLNIPLDPKKLGTRSDVKEKEKKGKFLDFMISPDFVRKIGEIWNIRIKEVRPVYYPYWMVTHKEKRYLIDALNNKLEMEKSKSIKNLLV